VTDFPEFPNNGMALWVKKFWRVHLGGQSNSFLSSFTLELIRSTDWVRTNYKKSHALFVMTATNVSLGLHCVIRLLVRDFIKQVVPMQDAAKGSSHTQEIN
jgi:hypothetical protein